MMQQIGFNLESAVCPPVVANEYQPNDAIVMICRKTGRPYRMIIETCEHNEFGEPVYFQCRDFIGAGDGYNERHHVIITSSTQGRTKKLYCSGSLVIAKAKHPNPRLDDPEWRHAEWEIDLIEKEIEFWRKRQEAIARNQVKSKRKGDRNGNNA